MSSVGAEWPKERARLAQAIDLYRSIGPAGRFATVFLEDLARRADAAWERQEVTELLPLFQEMKEVRI